MALLEQIVLAVDLFLPFRAQLLLDKVANELAHHLGGGNVLLIAQAFKGGFFLGVDQQGEAGSTVFHEAVITLKSRIC